jgi:hypothetical protein
MLQSFYAPVIDPYPSMSIEVSSTNVEFYPTKLIHRYSPYYFDHNFVGLVYIYIPKLLLATASISRSDGESTRIDTSIISNVISITSMIFA